MQMYGFSRFRIICNLFYRCYIHPERRPNILHFKKKHGKKAIELIVLVCRAYCVYPGGIARNSYGKQYIFKISY